MGTTDSPIYNQKVKNVLKKLGEGTTRKELAKQYDYSNWKSLDTYMRRKGFRYDAEQKNYVPDLEEVESSIPKGANSKVALIISLFANSESDPKEIAKKVGLKNHRELAEYMTSRGYIWSSSKNNYVEDVRESKESEKPKEQKVENTTRQEDSFSTKDELSQYLPLLRKLAENEEKLYQLLTEDISKIPKYCVPGDSMTKSIYMGRKLAQLIEEFSEVKNVSQREIVEAALIEYLKKYGFAQEMDALFERA